MLDEAERRQLAEIEVGLAADDPDWVQRLHGSEGRRRRRRSAAVATALSCISLTAIVVGMLVGGAAVGFVVGVVVIGLAAVLAMYATNASDRRV